MLLAVSEPRAGYSTAGSRLTEADLSCIWEGQTFPPGAMTAAGGTELRVVYRGRRGHGAGPDFRDAIVAAPYGLLEGDVELHLRSSDFRRHGHHLDPAYDGVVLHLVMENDAGGETVLRNGRRVPVVALGDWLHERSEQIATWASGPPRWQEPCRDSVGRLGAADVARTLDRLGDMRFRAAAASLAKRLAAGEAPDDLLWQGVLEALGYGGQRLRFQRLAAALPWSHLSPRLTADTASERRAQALHALVTADSGAPAPVTGSLRPANRFEKRLEGAAALAVRYPSGLASAVLSFPKLEPKAAARELLRLLTVPRTVGRSRAIEIAANAVLPLLAAVEGGHYERAAARIYSLLPLPARYGPVRHLHEALMDVRIDARRQQGMLYLLKQYCTQGGCGRCPLS